MGDGENDGNRRVHEADAAGAVGETQVVSERGTERAGEDVRSPRRQHRVGPQKSVSQAGYREQPDEHEPRPEVASLSPEGGA